MSTTTTWMTSDRCYQKTQLRQVHNSRILITISIKSPTQLILPTSSTHSTAETIPSYNIASEHQATAATRATMWFGLFKNSNSQPSNLRRRKDYSSPDTGKANQAICGFCSSQLFNATLPELRRRYGRPYIIIKDFVSRLQKFN